jgi:hypothetical protein
VVEGILDSGNMNKRVKNNNMANDGYVMDIGKSLVWIDNELSILNENIRPNHKLQVDFPIGGM